MFRQDRITTTNGKELVNYDIPLELGNSLTIPLPLALIQSKAAEAGTLSYWPCSDTDYRFRIQVGSWSWIGKTLSGIYPNWRQVIPDITEFGGGIEDALSGIHIHPLTARMIPEHPGNTAARNSRLFGYIINCNFPVILMSASSATLRGKTVFFYYTLAVSEKWCILLGFCYRTG